MKVNKEAKTHVLIYLPIWALLFISFNLFAQINDNDSLRLKPDTTGVRDTMHLKIDSTDMKDKNDMKHEDLKKDNNLDGSQDGSKYYNKNNHIRNLFYIPSHRYNIYNNRVSFSELIYKKTDLHI